MADIEAQTVSLPQHQLKDLVQMLAATVDILKSSIGNDNSTNEGTTEQHELAHLPGPEILQSHMEEGGVNDQNSFTQTQTEISFFSTRQMEARFKEKLDRCQSQSYSVPSRVEHRLCT